MPDAVPAHWEVGDLILGKYEVTAIHEGGGMGLVYRVNHKNWNVDLAVKSPREEFFRTDSQKQDFIRECQTWIGLGIHPFIATCYYVRTLGGVPRIFAEYIEGGSLKAWINSGRLYQGTNREILERILNVSIQMALGLHYAHTKDLIHQDVKPGNVLMTQDGVARITDFGLAKARSREAAESHHNASAGVSLVRSCGGMTPAYCSPEQASRQSVTRRTDTWSWAVSVLEMFTVGIIWVDGRVAPLVLEAARSDQKVDGVAIPVQVADVLHSCFQDVELRPRTMADVAAQMAEVYQVLIGRPYPKVECETIEQDASSLNNYAVSALDLV